MRGLAALAVALVVLASASVARAAPLSKPKPLGSASVLIGASRGLALVGVDATSIHLLDVRTDRRFSVPAPPGQEHCHGGDISWGRVLLGCRAVGDFTDGYWVQDVETGARQLIGQPGSDYVYGGLGRYHAAGSFCYRPGRCNDAFYDLRTGATDDVIEGTTDDLDLDRPDGQGRWCTHRRNVDFAAGRTVVRFKEPRITFLTCGLKRRTARCKHCSLAAFDGTRLLTINTGRLRELHLRNRRIKQHLPTVSPRWANIPSYATQPASGRSS